MTDFPFSENRIVDIPGSRRVRRFIIPMIAGALAWAQSSPVQVVAQGTELANVHRPDPAPPPRVDAQLALARVCASEIGLTGSPEECAAIHAVLARRASRRGNPFMWTARAYSSRVFDASRRDARAWIAHLRPDGRAPAGWPTHVTIRRGGQSQVVRHASWAAYRARWLTLYEAAGRIVRGEITSPCQEEADHWGMRSGIDLERARRAGWQEVDCGETRNAFWRVVRDAQDG